MSATLGEPWMIIIPGWRNAKWETLADGKLRLVWSCFAFRDDSAEGDGQISEVITNDAEETRKLAAFCQRTGCTMFEVVYTKIMTPVAL